MHCPPNRCLFWICYLRIFPEYQIGGNVPVALQVWFIHATSCVDNNMQRSGIYSHNLQWQHDGCLWQCYASLNCNLWRHCCWITDADMNGRCLMSLIESGGVLDWLSVPSWLHYVFLWSGRSWKQVEVIPPLPCPPSFLPPREPSASLLIVEYFTKQGN